LAWQMPVGPGRLALVTAQEEESLRESLVRGQVPQEFEMKLRRLATGNALHRYLEHHCRLLVELLEAAYAGKFLEASPQECRRLLRVLAYVRKFDDEIPDYKPDGYKDDQEEMRAATIELSALIKRFKAWRLQHQVPAMWLTE
jgi:hypothetical protein